MIDIQYGSKPLHAPLGKIYLFGDVHNEADKLMNVLDQIEPLITPDDHIVFLGDLVDRGTQAALTIEVLVDFAKKYPDQVFFVRGNHDYMLQNYLLTGSQGWFQYLQITLDNYKEVWNLPDILPDTITKALLDKGFKEITSRMIPYYETNEILATHAPFDYSVCMMNGLDFYEEQYNDRANNPNFRYFLEKLDYEILWQFTDENLAIPAFKKFRVCGHQPGRGKHPRLFKDRAFIDSGCRQGRQTAHMHGLSRQEVLSEQVMKEKNHKRKIALKKQRELIVRRKNLHKDIAKFLVSFWMCNTQHPLEDWKEMMMDGFKGYGTMRGRDLVKRFDDLHMQLRTVKSIGLWADRDVNKYNRHINYGMRTSLPDEVRDKVVEEFILESDALMNRLMELAFNLDVEE